MKKLISLLLCLCMVLSLLPTAALAAEPTDAEDEDGPELILVPLPAEEPEPEVPVEEPDKPAAPAPAEPEATLFDMPAEPLSITITSADIAADNYPGKYGSQWYAKRKQITSATVAEGVTALPYEMFDSCSQLASVTLPSTLTSIGSGAFYRCTALTSVDIPNGVTLIGSGAFSGCTTLSSVSLPSAWQEAGGGIFKDCKLLTEITVPEGITALPRDAFYGASYLQRISLPSTLTSIGIYAFSGCTALTSVDIPNGVTSIGFGAFYGCTALTSVDIPNGVTSIGDSAFSSCTTLSSVSLPSAWQEAGGRIFENCKLLTEITVPEGITALPGAAFYGASYLQRISLPSTLTSIGSQAFYGCTALKRIDIPDGVTALPYQMFHSCSQLASVTLPSTLTSIGSEAFYGCTTLSSVSLPSTLTSIGSAAFDGCTALKRIDIPDGVTTIDDSAFRNCTALREVRLPVSWKEAGSYAFKGCESLSVIRVPEGVSTVPSTAFCDANYLSAVCLPATLTVISYRAFYGCGALADVYYAGSEEQWQAISIDKTDNTPLESATIHYNSTGPVVRLAEMELTAGEHALRIINEEGEPLGGALVEWTGGSATSGADGIAKFTLTGAATVTISCEGYLTQEYTVGGATLFDNASEDTQKSSATDVVLANANSPLYVTYAYCGTTPEEAAKCNISRGKSGKDNTEKWFFTGGNSTFVLRTVASSPNDVASYALYRKRYEKVERVGNTWTGTSFVSFNTKDFSAGYDYFIRVTGKDGTTVDTRINLHFRNPMLPGAELGIQDNRLTISMPEDVYFVGGTEFSIYLPINSKIEYAVSSDKLMIGINLSIADGASNDQKLSTIRDCVKNYDKKTLDQLAKGHSKANFFGECDFSVAGYLELNASDPQNKATGKIKVKMDAPVAELSYLVPGTGVNLVFSVGASLEGVGEANYKLGTPLKELNGTLSADPGAKFTAFGGAGYSKLVAAGGYGSAEVTGSFLVLPASQAGFKTATLTGEIGFAYYVLGESTEYPLVSKSWQIYPSYRPKGAGLMSSDEAAFDPYDASQYHPADLSYLANESDWLGSAGASLMEAEAKTRLTRLLEDTYRDARPVMIASGDALYAAFVRADAETGARYVAVTKYSGGAWATPVRVDTDAILDGAPALCADGAGGVWLAYTKTAEGADDSLLSYAQHQRIVVGHVGSDTLVFTQSAEFSPTEGGGFVNSPELALLTGGPALLWADSAVTDDNSVLRPASSLLRCATYSESSWSEAQTLGTVNAPITSLALGEAEGAPAAAYTLLDDSGEEAVYPLYRMTASETTKLADNVTGKLQWATLPGTDGADFVWNETGALASASHGTVAAEGITHEYSVVGNNIYYSRSSEGGADLAVLQYHAENGGFWGMPIRLTDESDEESWYLENLSAAALNGQDYVFGMNTNPTITETDLIDKKDLVWSAIMPVSDLRLDGVEFDAPNAGAVGKALPVTLTVTNAGDHTVTTIAVTAAGTTTNKTVPLKPGESTELAMEITCPDSQTSVAFSVAEPDKDDYTPEDNAVTHAVACADAALELNHVSIGKLQELEALVTNEGIEPASGNVNFYNANGDLLATRTFEGLAPGGLVVARLTSTDAASLFDDGGDVSAEVVLDGSEDVLWNNTASKHIDGPDTAVMSVEISGTSVSAEIYCAEATGGTAYCASYDADGKMLGVTSTALTKGNNTASLTCIEDAEQVKVFVLNEKNTPICPAWIKKP